MHSFGSADRLLPLVTNDHSGRACGKEVEFSSTIEFELQSEPAAYTILAQLSPQPTAICGETSIISHNGSCTSNFINTIIPSQKSYRSALPRCSTKLPRCSRRGRPVVSTTGARSDEHRDEDDRHRLELDHVALPH